MPKYTVSWSRPTEWADGSYTIEAENPGTALVKAVQNFTDGIPFDNVKYHADDADWELSDDELEEDEDEEE